MRLERVLALSEKLMSVRSLSGMEQEVLLIMEAELIARGFVVEKLPVPNSESWNILATVERPEIVLSTHLDVVPAPEPLFVPEQRDGKLWGRGACDAKGIAATMVEVATSLSKEGAKNVGLLFLVDEEATSSGAKAAAPVLREKGVKYIINGEPTDCVMVSGHKGALTVDIYCTGRAAHSGYPELGDDANLKLIKICNSLLSEDLGQSELFGRATINLGLLDCGIAANVISPKAHLRCLVRTVTSNDTVFKKMVDICDLADKVIKVGSSEPTKLHTIPGFPTKTVSYGTDVPYLMESGAKCLLYGPGSINVAHTDREYVEFSQLESAYIGYLKIVSSL